MSTAALSGIGLISSIGQPGDIDARLWPTLVAAFFSATAALLALLRGAAKGGQGGKTPGGPLPILWRLTWPLIGLLEGAAAATMSPQRRFALEARLHQAGLARMLTPARHRAACWVAGLWGGLLGLLAGSFLPAASDPGPVLPLACATLGLCLPAARLRDRAASRQRALLRQLPFFLDLITLSVEAGLNLGAALAQTVDQGPPGPMREELSHLLQDLRAGRPRDEALRAMAERARSPAVSNLVAALATAQKQGASLGPILRAQAEQRRTERFLRAERLAMEAPVKMLLPLVLFIFPGTFAVLLFPVVSRLIAEGVL